MLKNDADRIIESVLADAMPQNAVRNQLKRMRFAGKGKVVLVAVGKAAWTMADSARSCLGNGISHGIVITKYGHSKGAIGDFEIYEAGHPVSDENSYMATERIIESVKDLTEEDSVLFLLSGGGSALFEKPLADPKEIEAATRQLLACGADIMEINTIRKRLSAVKGGRFAEICYPARIYSIILSDIVGDPLDMIASGPACQDSTTCDDALGIVRKYNLKLSADAVELLHRETPKSICNAMSFVIGSVSQLCASAVRTCRTLGYNPFVLTSCMTSAAREAGSFLASVARTHHGSGAKLAFIAGGETTVHVTGKGKGGRNQELALSAAKGIAGLDNVCVFSLGSDGTDGPTDAAGGIVFGDTASRLSSKGFDIDDVLRENDSYTALDAVGSLVKTGPTGTNVNDVSVVLVGY